MPKNSIAAERVVVEPAGCPKTHKGIEQQYIPTVFRCTFNRRNRTKCKYNTLVLKRMQDLFNPVGGNNAVCIGSSNNVIHCPGKPIVTCTRDPLRFLDENMIRVFCCDLTGVVF